MRGLSTPQDFNLVGYPGANWFERVLMALRDRQYKELSVRWGQVTAPIPEIFVQRAARIHAKWRPDGSVAEPWGQVGTVSVLEDLTVHLGPSGDVPGSDAHFHRDMMVRRLGSGTTVDHLLGGVKICVCYWPRCAFRFRSRPWVLSNCAWLMSREVDVYRIG